MFETSRSGLNVQGEEGQNTCLMEIASKLSPPDGACSSGVRVETPSERTSLMHILLQYCT